LPASAASAVTAGADGILSASAASAVTAGADLMEPSPRPSPIGMGGGDAEPSPRFGSALAGDGEDVETTRSDWVATSTLWLSKQGEGKGSSREWHGRLARPCWTRRSVGRANNVSAGPPFAALATSWEKDFKDENEAPAG